MAKKKISKKKRQQPERKSNLTLIYVGLAVIVIAAFAYYFFSNPSSENISEKLPAAGKYVRLEKPGSYEPGKVKIIEFMKFNCPHCYNLNQQMPGIKQKYGDKLEITYKPMLWKTMPQELLFKKSIEAYILAERMGKGEEIKDALFRALVIDKKDLTNEVVLGDIARSVGLGDYFSTALKNGEAKDEAEENIRLAEEYQVYGTPTIIINGNLKVDPLMTNEDMDKMKENLDMIIGSLLS